MPSSAHTVRFGPFVLDLRAAELCQDGTKVKLAEQSFQILAELAQHPGEVVTRDELRQRLWCSDTFVDFEHGLNTAMMRLREILGDSAEQPRYIETVPRRGYRLIVPVEEEQPLTVVDPKGSLRRRKIWLAAAVVGATVVALAVGLWWLHSRRVYALTPSDTIVIADFINSTHDPAFDDALKQALTLQLEQSPYLSILPDTKVQNTLHLMGRSTEERLTPALGREVCQRVGGKVLLWGSIANLGSQYVIGLTAMECSTGKHLAGEQTQSASKDDVLKVLGRAIPPLRSRLGESLGSVQKYDTPIEEVTTRSLEALKAYSLGRKALSDKGDSAAIPFYEHAIELDPNFAMAWAALGAARTNLNRSNQAAAAVETAFALRERVCERERFRISALYYRNVSGEIERSIQVYREWMQTYPLDDLPHHNLSVALLELGRWEDAITETHEELRLNQESPGAAYWDLAVAYLALNQPDAVEATFKQSMLHGADAFWFQAPMYYLAFLRGDTGEMNRLLGDAVGKEGEQFLLSAHSDTEAYYGHLVKARYFSRRAMDLELRAGSEEAAALWQANSALRDAEFGSSGVARRGISPVLAAVPGWRAGAVTALALARLGEITRAKTLIEEIEKKNPSNTRLRTYWLPVVKGAIALKQGLPGRAVTILEPAIPSELASPLPLSNVAPLYSAYLRGDAYLMEQNGPAAAAEFQKLLDHRGIVLNYPLGALVHLQLGRAYGMSGDTAKAKAAYHDFLTLWKDADPDLPILKQAKAEYAKLQ